MKYPSIFEIVALQKTSQSLSQPVQGGVAKSIEEVLGGNDEVERNKDRLNLIPNIAFVSNNLTTYQKACDAFLARSVTIRGRAFVDGLEVENKDMLIEDDVQVTPEMAMQLLSRLPDGLLDASTLKKIDYVLAEMVPVPVFDEHGEWKRRVSEVKVSEFPREEDHPGRILVGCSNGESIWPTAIPSSVSQDKKAIFLYQVHVFIHEFFHTLDYKRRTQEERSKLIFKVDDEEFTYQEWWDAFEAVVLSGCEPRSVSSYANTYSHSLNIQTKQESPQEFDSALAEQMAEAFVAYWLNIISNDDGWTDFRAESFGNQEMLGKFIRGEAPSANLKWILMDKLCRAQVNPMK